jgi:hypothetical protein
LPSLEEVERSIKKHKHLPGVPPAPKIKKEGIDLSKMQVILMKKIEELTLYTIRHQKQMEKYRLENAELQKRLTTLESKLLHRNELNSK